MHFFSFLENWKKRERGGGEPPCKPTLLLMNPPSDCQDEDWESQLQDLVELKHVPSTPHPHIPEEMEEEEVDGWMDDKSTEIENGEWGWEEKGAGSPGQFSILSPVLKYFYFNTTNFIFYNGETFSIISIFSEK